MRRRTSTPCGWPRPPSGWRGVRPPGGEAEEVGMAALLHHIGELGFRAIGAEGVAALAGHERDLARLVPSMGGRVLASVDTLAGLAPTVLYQHERVDGSGYPDGLVRETSPSARGSWPWRTLTMPWCTLRTAGPGRPRPRRSSGCVRRPARRLTRRWSRPGPAAWREAAAAGECLECAGLPALSAARGGPHTGRDEVGRAAGRYGVVMAPGAHRQA